MLKEFTPTFIGAYFAFCSIFLSLVQCQPATSILYMTKGEFAAETNSTNIYWDNYACYHYSSLNLNYYDMKITFTGWIQTGAPQTISSYQSKIQFLVYAGPPFERKIMFFGNNATHFTLRQDVTSTIRYTECTLPHEFNKNYRFIVSFWQVYATSVSFSMAIRDLSTGSTVTCGVTQTNATRLVVHGDNYMTIQIQKPVDIYSFSNQKMGEVSAIKNFYWNATTDLDMQRFLLGFGGNSLQVFHFRFGYEQKFCNCLVDATDNRVRALSSSTYLSNKALGATGFYLYNFTQNNIFTFSTSSMRFGQKSDILYEDIEYSHPGSFRVFKSLSIVFWLNFESSVSSFSILSYLALTNNVVISVAVNSAGGTSYSLKITDKGVTTTLINTLSASTFYHVIIAINSGFVETYINGNFIGVVQGDFSTFFAGTVIGSSIQIGGSNIPASSKFQLTQLRMFSSNGILSLPSVVTTLIANCATVIIHRDIYECLICSFGYFLHQNTCIASCASPTKKLTSARLCIPISSMSCATWDATNTEKCLTCAGNRVFRGGLCECPTGTYEDFQSISCQTVKRFTNGVEMGQFSLTAATSKVVYFATAFIDPPNVVISVLGYSSPQSQNITYFQIVADSITNTQMTILTNTANPINVSGQFFAYESSNPLFFSGSMQVDMNMVSTGKSWPMPLGQYTGKSTGTYQVHMYLGGFGCYKTTSTSYDLCYWRYVNDRYTAWAYTVFDSQIVNNMLIHYLITPIETAFTTYEHYHNPTIYASLGTCENYMEKISYRQLNIPIQWPLNQGSVDVDLFSFDLMYGYAGMYMAKKSFSKFKMNPLDMVLTGAKSMSLNIEFVYRTSFVASTFISVSQFVQTYSSFALCQYVDYYTDKCLRCSNGKSVAMQCSTCKASYVLDGSSNCVCPSGTWEDTDLDECVTCDRSCATCTNSTSCTTCLGTLVQPAAPLGLCQCTNALQWFDASGSCFDCNSRCATCISGTSCTSCYFGMSLDGSNICQCNDTTKWFDSINKVCQPCYMTCLTCSSQKSVSENCLSCVANRQLVSNDCKCPGSNDTRIFPDELTCSRGTIGVMDIQLSIDYLTLVIDFGTSIATGSAIAIPTKPDCAEIFTTATMPLIGLNSKCTISGSTLTVQLGSTATVMANNQVFLKANSLKFTYNSLDIVTFLRNTVVQLSAVSASIEMGYLANQDFCYPQYAKIKKFINDGGRGYTSVTWTLVSVTPFHQLTWDSILDSITTSNTNQSNFVYIALFMIPNDIDLVFTLHWVAQIGTTGDETVSIHLKRSKTIRSTATISQPAPYFRGNDIEVVFSFVSEICSTDGKFYLTDDLIDVKITNALLGLSVNSPAQSARSASTIIPAFSTTASYTYVISAELTLTSDTNVKKIQNCDLPYSLTELYVVLGGGNRQVSYRKPVVVNGTLADYELDYSQTPKPAHGITMSWECFEIAKNDVCKDPNGNVISLPSSSSTLTIPGYMFSAFTVARVKLVATKLYTNPITGITTTRTKTDSIVVFFTEMDIPPLDLTYDSRISMSSTVNYNQLIHVEMSYDSSVSPNNLFYSGAILYNNEVVAIMVFEYSKVRFRVWDYFSAFDVNNGDFQLRFSVYNPSYILPSLSTTSLTLNFPPQYCYLTVTTPGVATPYALNTRYMIEMHNCTDSDGTIKYQFFYYESATSLAAELADTLKVQRKQLSEITTSTSLSTVLPPGNLILLVRAIDMKDAISNCTATVNSVSMSYTSASYTSFVSSFMSSVNSLIPEEQIINLSLLTDDTLVNGASLLSGTDLLTTKNTLISSLQTASSLILSTSYLYQLSSQSLSKILASPMQISTAEQSTRVDGLASTLSNISSKCVSSSVSQEKYQACMENIYLAFNQVDSLSVNAVTNDASLNGKYIAVSQTIGDMLAANSLPNENQIEYHGQTFKVQAQKITDKFLTSYTGISQTRRRRLIQEDYENDLEHMIAGGFKGEYDNYVNHVNPPVGYKNYQEKYKRFQREQFYDTREKGNRNLATASTSIYNAVVNTYDTNLYSQDASFMNYTNSLATAKNGTQMTTVFPVINPTIKLEGSNDNIATKRGSMLFFENKEPSKNLTCISKNPKDEWTTEQCSTSKNDETNEVYCLCPGLSPTSVVEDIGSLFTENENLNTAFGSDGLSNISNFTNFYAYIAFWVLLAQSIMYIAFIIRGNQLDKINRQQLLEIGSNRNSTVIFPGLELAILQKEQEKVKYNPAKVVPFAQSMIFKDSGLQTQTVDEAELVGKGKKGDVTTTTGPKSKHVRGEQGSGNGQSQQPLQVSENNLNRHMRIKRIGLGVPSYEKLKISKFGVSSQQIEDQKLESAMSPPSLAKFNQQEHDLLSIRSSAPQMQQQQQQQHSHPIQEDNSQPGSKLEVLNLDTLENFDGGDAKGFEMKKQLTDRQKSNLRLDLAAAAGVVAAASVITPGRRQRQSQRLLEEEHQKGTSQQADMQSQRMEGEVIELDDDHEDVEYMESQVFQENHLPSGGEIPSGRSAGSIKQEAKMNPNSSNSPPKLKRTKKSIRKIKSAKDITKEDKDKITEVPQYKFVLYFHDFFAVFFVFMEELSRAVRFVLLYCRYLHALAISILFSSIATSIVQTMFVSVFSGVIIAVVSKVVSSLLMNKRSVLQQVGKVFTFLIALFYIYIILAVTSGNEPEESNEFFLTYAIFLCVDIFIVQTATAVVMMILARQILKFSQDQNTSFIMKVFDFLKLNIIIQCMLN